MHRNTKQSKFVLADTGSDTIHDRFGTIGSYNAVNFQVDALVSPGSMWTDKDSMPITIHT